MTTLDIAKKYVELCKARQNELIVRTLFSPDIVSVEAAPPPGRAAESRGTEALLAKAKQWADNHELHSMKIEGPWPHGDRFIVHFVYDVTRKPTGQHLTLDETALFTVQGDRIVREEFFYGF
jgi:ketosteroid isomerase-like protein